MPNFKKKHRVVLQDGNLYIQFNLLWSFWFIETVRKTLLWKILYLVSDLGSMHMNSALKNCSQLFQSHHCINASLHSHLYIVCFVVFNAFYCSLILYCTIQMFQNTQRNKSLLLKTLFFCLWNVIVQVPVKESLSFTMDKHFKHRQILPLNWKIGRDLS